MDPTITTTTMLKISILLPVLFGISLLLIPLFTSEKPVPVSITRDTDTGTVTLNTTINGYLTVTVDGPGTTADTTCLHDDTDTVLLTGLTDTSTIHIHHHTPGETTSARDLTDTVPATDLPYPTPHESA